jgi:SAM-dependent methyltransferase
LSDSVDRFLAEEIKKALPRGRVLDIPAGDGNLSRLLGEAGYEVTSADLIPERFLAAGTRFVEADMNERLPLADGSFDAIVCQEGVEHLEDLPSFLRECGRVLGEGGHLWITTPNFMDLSSRFSFFLTGMKSLHAGFPNEAITLRGSHNGRFYHGHAFSLPFFQIRYFLRMCDFDDIQVRGLGGDTMSLVLYTLVRPLSGFFIRRALRARRRKGRNGAPDVHMPAGLQAEICEQALSRDILLHRKLCIRATLRKGSLAPWFAAASDSASGRS